MKEITCRCGKTKKKFKFDVGPFFINTCCEEVGYDVHGRLPEGIEDPNPMDLPEQEKVYLSKDEQKTEEPLKLQTQDADDPRLLGAAVVNEEETKAIAQETEKLETMKLKELKAYAKEKGVKGYSTKTKAELIQLLLAE